MDAHLSYDTRATVDKALRLVDLYESKGIDSKERVYIKMVHRCLIMSSPPAPGVLGQTTHGCSRTSFGT